MQAVTTTILRFNIAQNRLKGVNVNTSLILGKFRKNISPELKRNNEYLTITSWKAKHSLLNNKKTSQILGNTDTVCHHSPRLLQLE